MLFFFLHSFFLCDKVHVKARSDLSVCVASADAEVLLLYGKASIFLFGNQAY